MALLAQPATAMSRSFLVGEFQCGSNKLRSWLKKLKISGIFAAGIALLFILKNSVRQNRGLCPNRCQLETYSRSENSWKVAGTFLK
jgi:hypothetical protein